MKKSKWMFFLFIVTIILMPNIYAAIGVSPSYYEVDFEPGLKRTFTFNFLSDGDLNLKIYAEGDLANYTKINKKVLEGPGIVEVTLKLPNEIELPGVHRLLIGGAQMTGEEDGVGIIGDIRAVIKVKVPYPGQYAETEFNIENINVGENASTFMKIFNKGTETIVTNNYVDIYESKYKLSNNFLGIKLLNPTESVEINKKLETGSLLPGIYIAKGITEYGSKAIEKEIYFRIGSLFINITDYTKYLERNKINKFEINVSNYWKYEIENVYANVSIIGKNINFLTPSVNVPGFGNSVLSGYFDTTGIEEKYVDAKIVLNYQKKTTEQIVRVRFEREMNYLVIGLVVAIIIILIVLVYFYLHIFKKNSSRKR